MKIKQVLASLFILIGMMSLLGGCSMTKETLTKEQQDNVVRWLIRYYEPITEVEFIQFNRDGKTGIYLLSLKLNGNEQLVSTARVDDISSFNSETGVLSLNPISRFESIERQERLHRDEIVDINEVNIIYLGED
ncbi:hypothetical protein [Streptococcus ruminantium]|uniref:hypothetical protein n=1 Tax=Streptococcus ruminantium TaxID=1917441 RepID=UPI0012DE061F|nr:hypothetical protein [Streptococcus ruminantium]